MAARARRISQFVYIGGALAITAIALEHNVSIACAAILSGVIQTLSECGHVHGVQSQATSAQTMQNAF